MQPRYYSSNLVSKEYRAVSQTFMKGIEEEEEEIEKRRRRKIRRLRGPLFLFSQLSHVRYVYAYSAMPHERL